MTASPTSMDTTAPAPVSFYQAFRYWLKLGFISFGGPAGQIAIMHHDLVEQKRWISDQRFLHALNYCMLLPGPEAQQLAIYIGWLMHKTWGGIMAGVLFVLPSFFILVALSWAYMAHGDLPAVAGILYGIKPAVVAIVLFAAYRIGSRTLKNRVLWAIAIAAFVAIAALKLPFPLIILSAALLGMAGGKWMPAYFTAGGHGGKPKHYGAALIDDHTPTPPHAIFSKPRMWRILAVGLGLWAAAMGLLLATQGWQNILTQMGWFFTKAALLTFGGAYAVLPYVYQGAVEHFHWLTATQMIDGLALGETTPGPLIMVVTFVGFVGGWMQASSLTTALLAASVVTFFTFLPSFIFIFLGAPFIESTHQNLKLTAPLTAITAAVVGIIFSLALFFAYHSFWPRGFDAFAAALSALALFALIRLKTSVITVILACAVVGFFYHVFW
ncbi:MAG: chromate efflux transporter [Methylophilaceae bacterium]